MIAFRNSFGRWVNQLTGGFGPVKEAQMAGGGDHVQTANIIWVVFFVLCILISAAIIYLLASPLTVEELLAALWGLFLGVTMLFFIAPKILITIVGSFIGVGVSDLAGMANVLENTALTIKKIVHTLNSAFEGDVTIHPVSAWIFLIIIMLCCLPAYAYKE